ncbi:MAG: DUF373 family protein [Thermoplasmata archaeon]
MVTLVLCVDRDDDIGRKTGEKGPIIGRDENLRVANLLALADPEDSDTNAIFGAVSTYDALKKDGRNVEVATITGSESVGIKSDEKLRNQFLELISRINVENVILVSDGEEDEFILPIITSIVPVLNVKRIIVKQSRGLESTYYILVKALKDKETVRKILLPISLILLAFSFSVFGLLVWEHYYPKMNFLDPGTFGLSVVFLTLGFYFLIKSFRVGTRIIESYRRFRKAFADAKISITSDAVAILIGIFGILSSYDTTVYIAPVPEKIALFFQSLVPWVVLSIVVRESGVYVDLWLHQKTHSRGIWTGILIMIGLGIIFYGAIMYIRILLGYISSVYTESSTIIISLGILLSIFASIIRRIFFPEEEANELQ